MLVNNKFVFHEMNYDPIKIVVTGDFCPINRVEELARSGEYNAIFNDFIDELKGNDINIIDLECPLTESISSRPKIGPHQKAHPDCINLLKYADVNLVAMANNHIMDFDTTGVIDTLELCKNNNLPTVGIGKTTEKAAEPYTVSLKGKRIAILNFADNEFLSTTDGLFHCNPIDPVLCFSDIRTARKENDYVIVLVHAGNEFYEFPSPRTKRLYRYFVDIGADVVVSHHTHIFSGYEIYNSRPIFYGLGNFLYDWPGKRNERWNIGYVVKLLINDQMDFQIIPLKQSNENPGIFHLNEAETKLFYNKIDILNDIIVDDIQLEKEFQKYCNSVFPMYDSFIEPYFGKFVTALQKRGFLPKLLSGKKRLLLLNLIRCESHRDVLLRMLKGYE